MKAQDWILKRLVFCHDRIIGEIDKVTNLQYRLIFTESLSNADGINMDNSFW